MNEKDNTYLILIAIIITVGILLTIYKPSSRENYYKSLVKETVREMVREECLK